MDIRQIMERTQALNMFWEREIDKVLKLKPSAIVGKDEIVAVQEALSSARGGVSTMDLSDLWRSWTNIYSALVKLGEETTSRNSRDELLAIYGVNTPVRDEQ